MYCLKNNGYIGHSVLSYYTHITQLIGGLADEKIRWKESVDNFDKLLVNVIGDVMMCAGVVAYLGSFTVSLGAIWQLKEKINVWTTSACLAECRFLQLCRCYPVIKVLHFDHMICLSIPVFYVQHSRYWGMIL